MQEIIAALMNDLLGAKTFEDAATAVLRRVLLVADEALSASRYTGRGKLLRAMVHLRPDDGYRGLVVLESGAKEPGSPDDGHVPSASAFRWVAEYRSAVAIDVTVGSVEPAVGGAGIVVREKIEPTGDALGRESVRRLLDRSTTHLYALPLRGLGGAARIVGMISVEATCKSAVGRDFIWSEGGPRLELLADIASAYLSSLPLAPTPASAPDELLPVIGASVAHLLKMARVFAQQEETLLLSGPTGAGKSKLARWCHAQSKRRAQPLETIDLMTVPEELQMGELFGWKRGAFSGAVADNPGCIARAERGTLFIDEIDKLSLRAQAGILHVLEERKYRSLGEGVSERKADVRFLVGTNANLEEAVKAGRFREDLYYRINVLPLRLLPLDERADEIPLWADYMAKRRHQESEPDEQASVSPAAARALAARRWPGNLRQLDNVIRRAYALALVDRGAVPRGVGVVLEDRHIERALGYERGVDVEAESLLPLMNRAADAFVKEAERRGEAGPPLDLDLAEAFRGLVLGIAARKLGSKEAAFQLLGKASAVSHRNHLKVLRREASILAELYKAVGKGEPPPLGDLVEPEEK